MVIKPLKPIKNEKDYDQALADIESLFGAPAGSEEADRLEVLVTIVQAYEARIHPLDAEPRPSPQPGFGRAILGDLTADDLALTLEEKAEVFREYI